MPYVHRWRSPPQQAEREWRRRGDGGKEMSGRKQTCKLIIRLSLNSHIKISSISVNIIVTVVVFAFCFQRSPKHTRRRVHAHTFSAVKPRKIYAWTQKKLLWPVCGEPMNCLQHSRGDFRRLLGRCSAYWRVPLCTNSFKTHHPRKICHLAEQAEI